MLLAVLKVSFYVCKKHIFLTTIVLSRTYITLLIERIMKIYNSTWSFDISPLTQRSIIISDICVWNNISTLAPPSLNVRVNVCISLHNWIASNNRDDCSLQLHVRKTMLIRDNHSLSVFNAAVGGPCTIKPSLSSRSDCFEIAQSSTSYGKCYNTHKDKLNFC